MLRVSAPIWPRCDSALVDVGRCARRAAWLCNQPSHVGAIRPLRPRHVADLDAREYVWMLAECMRDGVECDEYRDTATLQPGTVLILHGHEWISSAKLFDKPHFASSPGAGKFAAHADAVRQKSDGLRTCARNRTAALTLGCRSIVVIDGGVVSPTVWFGVGGHGKLPRRNTVAIWIMGGVPHGVNGGGARVVFEIWG
jgi:hypothetical protein